MIETKNDDQNDDQNRPVFGPEIRPDFGPNFGPKIPYVHTTENSLRVEVEQTLLRYALQAEARAILSREQIAKCLRVSRADSVDVLYDAEHQKAHYSGLVTCHSVWHCPICAAKISERRRDDTTRAIEAMNELDYRVFFATYTIKHGRHDSLKDLLTGFLDAHTGMTAGTNGQKLRRDFGIIGTIRALETTWGLGTSWHPHAHVLIFVGNQSIDEDELEERLWKAWQRETKRVGLPVHRKGFDFDRTRGAAGDYVAKWGREPIQTPWGVEHEIAKAHIKQSRLNDRYTPFGMLRAIHEGGHDELIPRFREYAMWFKGKRQVRWTPGLAALMGLKDKTDAEIAEEQREEAYLLGRLTREQWKVVLANDVRGEILLIARQGQWCLVADFLRDLGAEI
jgi:hypothetical protein